MPLPIAQMGFVGSVVLRGGTFIPNLYMRVSSCGVQAKQNVEPEGVIDGKIDSTVYKVMPREVEGEISFPFVEEISTLNSCDQQSQTPGNAIWNAAVKRDAEGRLISEFDVDVRYTDSHGYTYPKCQINTCGISVTQGDTVKCSFNVIGKGDASGNVRVPYVGEGVGNYNAPIRAITFNDFRLTVGYGGANNLTFNGDYVREFKVDVNNNIERVYTLNGKLAPQDITAKKRNISGSLTLMGYSGLIKDFYQDIYDGNQNRYSSQNRIRFGYVRGNSAQYVFDATLGGVIYKVEEVSLSNDLITTTVNFIALGDCTNNWEATTAAGGTGTPASPDYRF